MSIMNMYASAVKIMFSGWYFLLIPFLYPVLDIILAFIFPVELIVQYNFLFFILILLGTMMSAFCWSFLAFFAHRSVLNKLGRKIEFSRNNISIFVMLFLIFSLLINLPSLVQNYVFTTQTFFGLSSSEIIFFALVNLAFTAILGLVVLSIAGILLPASMDAQQDGYRLSKSQGIAHSLQTAWLLLRFPGSVYIIWVTIHLAVWGYTGEPPETSLLKAIINQSGFAPVLFRYFANGLIVVLTAMVLSHRYVKIRSEMSLS